MSAGDRMSGPGGWGKTAVIIWMLAVLSVFVLIFAPSDAWIFRLAPTLLGGVREFLLPWFTGTTAT